MQEHEMVVLVDVNDNQTGIMEKMKAHEEGLLHRAFSVLLFNENEELLLQKRALHKYHSGGLWTNTCCSHPRPGEAVKEAAERRLQEEMGISCRLTKLFDFLYKASFENGLTEHEIDHVFAGRFSGAPVLNKEEAIEWKYISIAALNTAIAEDPASYTPWFKILMQKINEEHTLAELPV